ncbi:MAG TPA: translation initiation factor IF-2 subunit gamma [Alphaproteobacteria bacterium]|nr:translation initiation factor IF-2 subunit gamma [Alphaproteobacteria bacterium]
MEKPDKKKKVKNEFEIKKEKEAAELKEKVKLQRKKDSTKSSGKDFDSNTQASSEPVQPSVNIGLVGHVDHGKTTLTEKMTGKWTDTHSEEIKRGITIRLGYADVTFRKCPECEVPDCYSTSKTCPIHNVPTQFVRKVSFVDAPGHESLMATMLSGAAIIDGAILLVAANEFCPQPQTREHLMALEMSGIKNVVIVQNKIDLVDKERLMKNHSQIKDFLKGTSYENSPIIPISAQHNVNLDLLIDTIDKVIVTPKRDSTKDPMMFVARSFDINKPGTVPAKIKGGIIGGAIMQGILKAGDRIEIRPGRIVEEANQIVAKPLFATVTSAMTGSTPVSELHPGGSVALMTDLDPSVVNSDKLTGNVVGIPGKLPKIWYNFDLEVHLLERVVGSKEDLKVDPIKLNEVLMLNVNSAATVGFVNNIGKNRVKCKLKLPVCAEINSKVTISRRVGTRFRLIGYGIIKGEK